MRVIQERNSSGTPLVAYTRGSDLSDRLWRGREGVGSGSVLGFVNLGRADYCLRRWIALPTHRWSNGRTDDSPV